jgi:hypothetical protein
MATFEEVEKLIQETYSRTWEDWFGNNSGLVPAGLSVDLNCTDSGYNHIKNIIVISLGEWEILDSDVLDPDHWPHWKGDLIHEMLHEYQFKIVKGKITTEGVELHRKYCTHFLEPIKHPPEYFTAIIEKFDTIGLPEQELIKQIK